MDFTINKTDRYYEACDNHFRKGWYFMPDCNGCRALFWKNNPTVKTINCYCDQWNLLCDFCSGVRKPL